MYNNTHGHTELGLGFMFHAGNGWSNGITSRQILKLNKSQMYIYLQTVQATSILVTTITNMATKWNCEIISDKLNVVLISRIS
jgi:hypothetical protein